MNTANVINGNLPPNTTFLQRTPVPQPGVDTSGAVINVVGQAAASTATNAEPFDPAQHGGKPDQQEVANAVKDMNKFLQMVRRTLVFTVDEDSGRTVVQIKDADTDQVIRQIPPENMLTIAKQMDKFKGLLFEEKA